MPSPSLFRPIKKPGCMIHGILFLGPFLYESDISRRLSPEKSPPCRVNAMIKPNVIRWAWLMPVAGKLEVFHWLAAKLPYQWELAQYSVDHQQRRELCS